MGGRAPRMRKIKLKKSPSDRLKEHFALDLNDAQREAATAPDGFNLILAGPGSGKTRVITYRVAYLIARGVPAESILLVTFTRRAAREMVSRLETLIGSDARRVWSGTFHHIGNRLIRRSAERLGFNSNFTILDSEDQLDVIGLAMNDAGLLGTGAMAPKPARIQHILSFAFNTRQSLVDVLAAQNPDMLVWLPAIEKTATAYAARKRAANCLDYDDLLGEWARLIVECPDQLDIQARMFRHILVDEMQDTNTLQVELVEAIARAGAGNLTAVGDDAQSIYRFRGANYDNILKFPDRNPGTRLFHLDVNYRSTPEIVAFIRASIARNLSGFPKALVSARRAGMLPLVVATADPYEEADFLCQQILEYCEQGIDLGKMAVLYRNHHDSILLQAQLVTRKIPYQVRSGLRFFEQAHIKDVLSYLRIIVNPRDEAAWRRLLLLLPGIGPAKATAIWNRLNSSPEARKILATAETKAIVPSKSKGLFAAFVADMHKIEATDPENHPAAAIAAIMEGGYPETVRTRYERPDNRLADIEQLAVLAARYDRLDSLISDLLLAGDLYGLDSVTADKPDETLILSTIHQAKGLEWSRVFIPRLIEDSFPSHRALNEPLGEDEERRIFYVGVSRARDEITLTYPLTVLRGGRGSSVLTIPSRFLTEIDTELYETAQIEPEIALDWSSLPTKRTREAEMDDD
jgi:ATP-dependent DNA helicase UvrD/PcrA